MRTKVGTVAAATILAGTGLASIALACLALTTGFSSGPASPTGTVVGTLLAAGGSANSTDPRLPGTVSFVSSSGATVTLSADSTGTFTGQLPVGVYTVSGKSSEDESDAGTCSGPQAARVRAGATVKVTVRCTAA